MAGGELPCRADLAGVQVELGCQGNDPLLLIPYELSLLVVVGDPDDAETFGFSGLASQLREAGSRPEEVAAEASEGYPDR